MPQRIDINVIWDEEGLIYIELKRGPTSNFNFSESIVSSILKWQTSPISSWNSQSKENSVRNNVILPQGIDITVIWDEEGLIFIELKRGPTPNFSFYNSIVLSFLKWQTSPVLSCLNN